jgi:hypothetical protein
MLHQQRLINYDLNRLFPQALKADGVYVYDVMGSVTWTAVEEH